MLNIVLLVTCICIVVVLTLYLFWWNRIFGYLLGLVFRLSFWKQGESSTWVDIGKSRCPIFAYAGLLRDLRVYTPLRSYWENPTQGLALLLEQPNY